MGGWCSSGVRASKSEEPCIDATPSSSGGKLRHNPYPADYDPPFPITIVGTFSNHGIEPEFTTGAIVKINQDRGSVDFPFGGDPKTCLFCCLDGHGRDGDKVSQFAMESIHDMVEEDATLATDPESALKTAFDNTDEKLRRSEINSHSSGSSAVAVYMVEDRLWVANSGDSRAVVGQLNGPNHKAHDLTWDQKPDSDGERQRIEGMGGVVTPPEAEGLSSRVWTRNGRYGLSMARSIGDHLLAKHGVIATPEVESYDLKPGDEFMILATDGIWEFITSQEAVDICSKHTDATQACYELIYTATKLWRKEEGDYRDDITAIVVMLPRVRAHMKKQEEGVADLMSPTSKELRKKRSSIMLASPENPDKGNATEETTLPTAVVDTEKAKTFRKRRLSVNPMDDSVVVEARRQHDAEKQNSPQGAGNPDEPVPPTKERKRRLSLSPDMDETGKALAPKGM